MEFLDLVACVELSETRDLKNRKINRLAESGFRYPEAANDQRLVSLLAGELQ